MKTIKVKIVKLNKALIKLNNKIDNIKDYSYELLKLTRTKSTLKRIKNSLIASNLIKVNINFNQLVIADIKATKKGNIKAKENIKAVFELIRVKNLTKRELLRNDNILLIDCL